MYEDAAQDAGCWTPPREAIEAARAIFAEIIPNLADASAEYRVSTEVLDEEVYQMFRDHLRELAATLDGAVAGGDEKGARAVAHSLVGMGGSMDLPELSVAGAVLSAAARAQDWNRCRALGDRLVRWLDATGRVAAPLPGARRG